MNSAHQDPFFNIGLALEYLEEKEGLEAVVKILAKCLLAATARNQSEYPVEYYIESNFVCGSVVVTELIKGRDFS